MSVPCISALSAVALPSLVALGAAPAAAQGLPHPARPAPIVFGLERVDHGFGELLPHRIRELDASGNPTAVVVAIRELATLFDNLTHANPVLPVSVWPGAAVLPNGQPGNHYVAVHFDGAPDIASILDASPAGNGLTGAITVVAINPATMSTVAIPVRAFVGGRTFAGTPTGIPPMRPLQRWVELAGGVLVPLAGVDNDLDGVPDGLGFPGTVPGTMFAGAALLVDPRVVVLVPDADGDLATYETFPAGRQIEVRIAPSVTGPHGLNLPVPARASGTVGADALRPEVSRTPPPASAPLIVPGNGDVNVDPATEIVVQFTEPLQPLSVGSPQGAAVALPSPAIALTFGPAQFQTTVPFTARPRSAYDFTAFVLTPAFAFPGLDPIGACGNFSRVIVEVHGAQLRDLGANTNLLAAATFFDTGPGAGLVNAPVTPDALYVGRGGALPGLSVIDLNGFGASTGNPNYDPTFTTFPEGNSNYPNNPNVKLQGSLMRPSLAPGTCTFNGGAAGVFRLSLDSNLADRVLGAPLVTDLSDMSLGHALDSTFNAGPAPFGCQAGGGNLCAIDGLKRIHVELLGNTAIPGAPGVVSPTIPIGAENLSGWAPHPNPPPLVFPPTCVAPYLGGQEPTAIETSLSPPAGGGLSNLLGPGDPFGAPGAGIPPTGLLTPEQNAFFQGPSPPQATIAACQPYMVRQQVGQFLYGVDRVRRELVVLNSNRMLVVDRILLPDPTSLAMSPNLDLLAVTNQLTSSVTFVDIDPSSATFHTVVQEVAVGFRPRGIAWDPGNEDILVCSELDGTVSVLSAATLAVRKVVSSHLTQPFEVAITPRQGCFGFLRNVYWAYVLNRNGTVAVFESGPDGPNGWGYDDVLGLVPQTFANPKAIQVDPVDLRSAVWIAHERPIDIPTQLPGPVGQPALSKLVLASALAGPQPLVPGSPPQFRQMVHQVTTSVGPAHLTGIPVDLAFDNLRHLAGFPNVTTAFSAGTPAAINGKQLVRGRCPNVINTSEPRYLFAAVPNSTAGNGVVDALRIDNGVFRTDTNPFAPGIQSIPASNVRVLMDYFRQ